MNDPVLTVRRAGRGDLESVATLFDAYRQFYERPADAALSRDFIRDRIEHDESVILVAERASGTLAGFCQMYPSFCSLEAAPIFVLYDLFVRPEDRQTGAGRQLMEAARQHAAARGFVRLDLTTARTNLRAQSLYESLGWQRDEVFLAYSRAAA